jgi:small subunit ribosomal protein S7
MLRPIARRLPIGSAVRSAPFSAVNRTFLTPRRQYSKKPPSNDEPTLPPISDYIISQRPPSNTQTPTERIPHQTDKDIPTDEIFGEQSSNAHDDGLADKDLPVEGIFKRDPKAMKEAPNIIKNDGQLNSEGRVARDNDEHQSLAGRSGIPHVTEESIGTERVISGDDVLVASKSAPGEEIPVAGVPIEEVVGDGQNPEVMEDPIGHPLVSGNRTCNANEDPSSTSTKSTSTGEDDYITDATESTRKSILDLFGLAPPRKAQQKAPKPPVYPSKHEPGFSLPLQDLDLSAWDEYRATQHKITEDNINPEEWADLRRGTWDQVEPPQEPDPIEEPTNEIQAPHNQRTPRETVPLDLPLQFNSRKPPSPWDFFYPAPRSPASLQVVTNRQKRSPRKSKKDVYDPFIVKEKVTRWPFLYNRDQLVERCTNLLMVSGKKATAEKIMQTMFLRILELHPRVHPVTYFAEAIDRNAPLLKNSVTKTPGGRKSVIRPVALTEQQRIRRAWMFLIRGAGKGDNTVPFPERLANEVIKVMGGQASGLQVRTNEHKLAISNRLNVQVPRRISRR